MIYIYDITLNLNKELIEFFEWEEKDYILFIRRTPMYKVSSQVIKDLINNKIEISKELLDTIKDKTLLVNNENIEYLCLFTDNKTIIGVVFNKNGTVKYLSKLLIDEEEEVLNISSNIKDQIINYKIIESKQNNLNYLTRKEKNIRNNLKKEIQFLYKNNMIDKLNYFYYEYFNKISNDKEKVFNELIKTIENNFNDKHICLYEIIKMSYLHK